MAKEKKLVNSQTEKNVDDFIESIENETRKADAKVLVKLMSDLKGLKPKIWGKQIIGFGKYSYQRKNGEEYEWFEVGFTPGKARLSVHVMYDINEETELLEKLGPHKTGRGCLYINKLEKIDLDILSELIKKSKKWEMS